MSDSSNLEAAIAFRQDFFDEKHEAAFRLFNGFLEGEPNLVCDLYGKTLLLHNYARQAQDGMAVVEYAQRILLEKLPGLESVVVKTRWGDSAESRNGVLTYGTKATRSIREHGVRYQIDLTMNRDASFYLDTRNLRHWLIKNSDEQAILNTFAYTGSLGVAAVAGGARRVLQTDLNKRFLNVAKDSYTLNGFPITKSLFQAVDFWSYMSRLNRADERFDIVVLDPPFFADTASGTVDLGQNAAKLINKVRPLVRSGGRIVAINNALFTSGADYMTMLEELCEGGWVEIESLLPISADFTGSANSDSSAYVTDPAPFNHSTKIVVLRVNHRPT